MKNLFYVLVFALFSSSVYSQSIIERNYSDYLDDEEVTHVYVSGKMFDFAAIIAAGVEDDDVKELSEFASRIESFSLIKVPNNGNALAEYKKGMADIQGDYDELMRVRDEGNKFALYVDEDNDVVHEIVGLGIADGEFIALSLVGEMDLNKIAEFVSKIDNEEFEPFKRMTEYKPNDLKVYPNPTGANSDITVEIPEGMVGGTAALYNSNGSKIKTVALDSNKVSIDTDGLSGGNYFVEIQKEGVTMKKQVIVLQ